MVLSFDSVAHDRAPPVSAGWGSNIEFERSFGGKSRWRVRLQTGVLNICLPNNRVGVWAAPYTYRFSTTPPTARTPVTGNADRSRKVGSWATGLNRACARTSIRIYVRRYGTSY